MIAKARKDATVAELAGKIEVPGLISRNPGGDCLDCAGDCHRDGDGVCNDP